MATTTSKTEQKFFEIIRPDHNFEFIGRQNIFIGMSLVLLAITFIMLPLNAYVIGGRGKMLNWSVEFRGGTEMSVEFAGEQDPSKIRDALAAGGFHDAEVVKLQGVGQQNAWILRLGAVSALSDKGASELEAAFKAKMGADNVRKFEVSEGGDKVYVRLGKSVDVEEIGGVLKAQNVGYKSVNPFGRAEDNTAEIVLLSVTQSVTDTLDKGLGGGAVKQVLSADSVGAKAGKELRDNGITSLLAAIIFITIYIFVRFDLRYAPGTVVALLHDALLVVGAFALFYVEFSLTTVAAILTVIGYSMNDTIVVFDRIRENAARMRDKRFDRIVNASINETLSRTILTSATVFIVTLAMNVLGTGTVRDFAFAMNVGVIVGTYSSIFIASPILIWLNDKYFKTPTAKAK